MPPRHCARRCASKRRGSDCPRKAKPRVAHSFQAVRAVVGDDQGAGLQMGLEQREHARIEHLGAIEQHQVDEL